jgi:peptide/nickel transport system permease protein
LTLRSFLVKRIVYTIILVFFVIVLNFLIFQAMPGATGVQYNILGQRTRLSNQYYNYIVNLYDLNASYTDRFVAYVRNLLTFQFGVSYQYNQPVVQQMIDSGRLVNTLTLLGASTVLAIVIGIALGIIASKRRGTNLDSFLVSASLTTFSLPTFFMGILLIFIFALTLGWFPASGVIPGQWTQTSGSGSGYPSILAQIPVRLQYLFLPTLTLTLFSYGGFLLLTRATMMETLSEDYVLTAKAKGLSDRVILFKHAFKNASLPIVTASALAFGGILSGAIITETVFNWAGLGRWLYDAVLYKDYPVMQAMFYLIALGVIAANFISDVIYGIIDPRIRYE